LRADNIEQGLGTRRVGRSVLCFEEVDSTNDVAWDSARQADTDGLVVFAEAQRRGRGRQGRSWISPAGRNLLFSVLLTDRTELLPAEAVTIAAGLTVAEAIEETTGLSAELKWPNDVLLDGKKIAGVLVERRSEGGRVAMVIGIGLNVGATPPETSLDQPAGCLQDALGETVNRCAVARSVLRRLETWIEAIAAGRLSTLHEAWIARCGMLHERITVEAGRHRYTGRVADVSPLLGLELIDDHGLRIHLPAAGATILRRTPSP